MRLAEASDKYIFEFAQELGIHQNILYKWCNKMLAEGQDAFPGQGGDFCRV